MMQIVINNSIGGGTGLPGSGGGGGGFTNTYSLNFDGIDDYVDLSNADDLNFANDFTLSIWVKTSAIGSNQFIIDKSTNLSSGKGYSLRILDSGKVRFWSYSASGLIDSTTTLSADTWYHIAATHDRSGAVNKIYINGALNVTGASGGFSETTNNLRIGNSAVLGGPFVGNLDEASFYDSELSASQISDIYYSGSPTDLSLLSTTPIAWYRMGDNGSWKSPQFLIPNNENKDKVSNYIFELDGVDDYISFGDLSSLVDNKSKLSISLWMNLPNAGEQNRVTGKYGGSLTKWLGVNASSDKVNFVVSNIGSSLAYASTGSVLTDNTWHHVVCVFDGTQANANDRIKIYIDNIDEALTFNGTLPTSTYDFTLEESNPTWYIGQNGFSLGVDELRGKIDEYAIYSDVALTSSQVNELYNGGTPTALPSGAVAHYKMGEQANFTSNWLVDNSALDNYSKRSFEFDGIGDYVDCGDSDDFSFGNGTNDSAFSISAWVKMDDATNFGIVSKSDNTAGDSEYLFYTDGANRVTLLLYTALSVNRYRGRRYSVALTEGVWMHLAATYDGQGGTNAQDGIKIYLNGAPVDNTSLSAGTYIAMPNGSAPLEIGKKITNRSNGNIDEVAIFNSELSETAINDIYNDGEPTTIPSGAVAHWRMGEDASFNGTNWTVPDNVGSNNGTSNAMTVDDLVGEAPNYSGGGISSGMTIEDRVGEAPNSTSNALSFNMDLEDRSTDVPT